MSEAATGTRTLRAPCIGVALGDVTGIGPEVTLKALQLATAEATPPAPGDARYVLLGDVRWMERANRAVGLDLEPGAGPSSRPRITVHDPRPAPLPLDLAPGAALAARAAVDWLRYGAQRCLAGELDALVTAPVNKRAIERTGLPFVGQTEFLSELAGASRAVMMLLGHDDRDRWLRVALVTTHLPLRDVAQAVTSDKVRLAITRAAEACQQLRLPRARVGVCGLNPHAGEGGLFGREEIELIEPAVATVRAEGLDVHGPLAADTLFRQALCGEYDAVVAMYHDQGLGPLKLVAFDTGVNWTLGLPFIRTSPDHGTAYELAGRNTARPDSMLAALRLAIRLARSRVAGEDPALQRKREGSEGRGDRR